MQTVGRFASAKSPIPILGGVKITAGDGCLTIEATDLEKGATMRTAAEVIEPGGIVVPERVTTSLFNHLENGMVFLEKCGNTLRVKSGKSETVLSGYPSEEYPHLPEVKPEECAAVRVPPNVFKKAVRQTVFAASKDEKRPVFNSVFLKTSGANIEMAATDTHRMAWFKTSLESVNQETEAIIPSQVLNEISKIINAENNMEILLSDKNAYFKTGNISIVARLINGQYPDINTVIPKNRAAGFKVSAKEMLSALKRVFVLLDQDGAPVNMTAGPDGIVLHKESASCSAHEEVSAETLGDAGTVEIAFCCKYLIEAISVIHTDEIIIGVTGEMSPVIIEPAGEEGYLSLLMPVRLN